MEDLDQTPSKFHELNNAIHTVAVTTAVIKTTLDAQGQQSGRIELAVSAVNSRLDRFDVRMNDIEKAQLSARAELEKEIATVKAEVQSQVSSVSSELKESMALLSPVRLLVYGAATLILTAVINVMVTKAMITDAAPQMVAPTQVVKP